MSVPPEVVSVKPDPKVPLVEVRVSVDWFPLETVKVKVAVVEL